MARITVYGTQGCSRCLMIKKMLDNKKIKYDYLLFEDLNNSEKDNIMDLAQNKGIQSFPLIIRDNEIITIEEV